MGRPLPSTIGEVDFRAECVSAFPFQSVSPQREELLEIESCGHRCIERQQQKQSPGERHSNPSHHSEKTKVKDKKEIAGSDHHKAGAQAVQLVHTGTMTEIKVRRMEICSSGRAVRQKTAHCEVRARQPDRQTHVRKRRSPSVVRFSVEEDTADQVRLVRSPTFAKMTSG